MHNHCTFMRTKQGKELSNTLGPGSEKLFPEPFD